MGIKTRSAAIGASILLATTFGAATASAAPPPAPGPSPAPTMPASSSPSASVSPSSAHAGDHVTISGQDFMPGESIGVEYGGTMIASSVADASGSFSAYGTILDSMPEGDHPMDVNGSLGSNVTISFTVDAPVTPTPTTPQAPQPAPAQPAPADAAVADVSSTPDNAAAAFDATTVANETDSSSWRPLGLGLLAAAIATGAVGIWLTLRKRNATDRYGAEDFDPDATAVFTEAGEPTVGVKLNPTAFQAAQATQVLR